MNWIAIVVAAASSFLLGGLWYSNALFGAVWNREAGRDPKAAEGRHPARVFGPAIAFALVAAIAYAWLVPPPSDAAQAALQGLAVGAGLVAASFGINYSFATRSNTLLLVDGGYHTLQFLLYGLVIGLWR
jgi:hypothetical protein